MRFSISIVALAIMGGHVAVGVPWVRKNIKEIVNDKKNKACDDYVFVEPGPFEGQRFNCFANIMRMSASGIFNDNYHLCPNVPDNLPDWANIEMYSNITKTDQFGGFEVEIFNDLEFNAIPVAIVGKYIGIADGNVLNLVPYGTGVEDAEGNVATTSDGNIAIPKNTFESKVCTLFNDGNLMKCSHNIIEYCSSNDKLPSSPSCDGRPGQWLYSYSLLAVSALDTADCPAPPEGFCDSNKLPETPACPFTANGIQVAGCVQ